MDSVLVYDKDNCKDCKATEELLDSLGVKYETVNMSHDREALKKVKALGFKQAPVVIVGEDSWSGHQPEKIQALVGNDVEDDTWDF